MRDLVNAGALDLIVDTVEAGAKPDEARSWWVSYLAGKANEQETDLAGLSITPQHVARVIALVNEGKLTTKLARKAVDGVLAGEGDVDEVVEKRGLEVVRDDGAIEKAVDDRDVQQLGDDRVGDIAENGVVFRSVEVAAQLQEHLLSLIHI